MAFCLDLQCHGDIRADKSDQVRDDLFHRRWRQRPAPERSAVRCMLLFECT